MFSAEFNSNRDPSSAYNYLYKCQAQLSQATDAARKLKAAADAAQEELAEVEQAAHKEAVEKAEGARDRVQAQVEGKRVAAKQEELNAAYAKWLQSVESKRSASLADSVSRCQQARAALDRETPWQHESGASVSRHGQSAGTPTD